MKIKLNHPYALNEQGRRDNPEDSIYPPKGAANPNNRFFVVCDGVGGHSRGEVASQTVCAAFASFLKDGGEKFNRASFEKALEYAYAELDSVDTEDSEPKMGTTLAFVYFHSRGVTLAHIGDSRVYQLRRQGGHAGIFYKSRDHTHVNELVRAQIITEEEAATHPKRSVLTRVMQPNQPRPVKAEYNEITDVEAGDYFFLCTDGILESVDDEALCDIIGGEGSDESKMKAIHEACLENSQDNFSAWLISVDDIIRDEADIETPPPQITPWRNRIAQKDIPVQKIPPPRDASKIAVKQPHSPQPRTSKKAVLIAFLSGIAVVVLALVLFYGWKQYGEVVKGALVKLRASPGLERHSGNATPTATQQAERSRPVSGLVTVPDVIGNTQKDAESKLRSFGLQATVKEEHDEKVPSGQVIRQNPSAGCEVQNGKPIEIVLSLGPAPVQTPPADTGGDTHDNTRDNAQGPPPTTKPPGL